MSVVLKEKTKQLCIVTDGDWTGDIEVLKNGHQLCKHTNKEGCYHTNITLIEILQKKDAIGIKCSNIEGLFNIDVQIY